MVAARVAAAIVCALALTPIVGAASAVNAASPGSPAHLAIIVPITVPERSTGLIEAGVLESYTSEFGLLSRTLDQVVDRPVTLAIDPAIIASIRILGNAAPESAQLWLERLAAAENETFPLLWADSDVTAPLQAGAAGVLLPESFEFAIDPSHFSSATAAPSPSPTPTPTESPAPAAGPPALPTTESLTEWNYTIPSIVWPAMNSVTDADLGVLSESFETTVLSSGNVSGVASARAHATINSHNSLILDDELSALFSSTVATRSGQDWEQQLVGLKAAAAGLAHSGSTIIALDRGTLAVDTDLGATIDALAAAPAITPVDLSDVLSEPASEGTLTDRPQETERVSAVQQLLASESADRSFATIAAEPSRITAERRLDLLAVLGNGWRDNALGWATSTSEYATASRDLRASVRIVDSSAITLLADRASLPVTVANDLDQSITVLISVRPLTPLLKVENSFVAITVEPNSQRKGQIPVQSLSNGVVQIEVSLHGESGVVVGETARVETTVQAGWETPVTIALGGLVILVFVAGIIRTIVRRRRARASED